jgi:hypothetical protein
MISSPRSLRATLSLGLATLLAVSFGCADPVQAPVFPTAANLGKAPSGLSVSAATPPYGRQGETGEEVTVTGSGFAPGAVATWSRGGDTTKVVVRSTRFVSSTQLVATIEIAPDADLAFYDIAVTNPDRKKGIGTEMFEVTTGLAIGSLGGNTNANAVSDLGAAVGYTVISNSQRAFYWNETDGMTNIGGTNALGIDRAGTTIVGNGAGMPLVWTGAGRNWSSQVLPLSPGATGGDAMSVASDPITGVATIIGGSETFPVKRGNGTQPRLWRWTGTSWQIVVLPMPFANVSGTFAWVRSVNANGQATGAVRAGGGDGQGVVWETDGSFTVLGPGGTPGINAAGTAIAGFNYTNGGGGPRYYWRNNVGEAWNGPVILPGGCWDVTGMDDAGRIIARDCPIPGSSRTTGGVFAPPYTSQPTLLPGLGDLTEGGVVYGISRNGTYIVGTAKTRPTRVAVRWLNPIVP